MSYSRTPPDFMKDIFISPHNFSDPENGDHGEYVNIQMKNDLYNDSVYRITACQFSLVGTDEEELQIANISQCKGNDPLSGLSSYFGNQNKEQSQMISCEDWKIIRKKGRSNYESQYRVKIFQSKNDVFYPQIHPPTFWKLLKYGLFN